MEPSEAIETLWDACARTPHSRSWDSKLIIESTYMNTDNWHVPYIRTNKYMALVLKSKKHMKSDEYALRHFLFPLDLKEE